MNAKYIEEIATRQRVVLYCERHPGSPSAVRLPKTFVRSGVWVALLGPSVREGIAGYGLTVEDALRAFDEHYLNTLRKPEEAVALEGAPTSARSAVQNRGASYAS